MPDETIADLIERVERASGPDRELDALLHKAFIDPTVSLVRNVPENGGRFIGLTKGSAERYTASLDACLALVERVSKGAEYEISTLYGIAQVTLPLNASDPDECQTARRPDGNVPLAVLSALLRSITGVRA